MCFLQVQNLIKVAGVSIGNLLVWELHLSHICVFHRLRVLKVGYLYPSQSLSPLSALQELQELHITVARDEEDRETIDLLELLPQLKVLKVTDGLAVHMPQSITQLGFLFEFYADEGGFGASCAISVNELRTFRRWFSTFQAVLMKAEVDMQLFDQDPAQLCKARSGAPCLQSVSDLRLTFTIEDGNPRPLWCPGFFKQLRTLHLCFREPSGVDSANFCPCWDLSSCTALEKLTISMDANVLQRTTNFREFQQNAQGLSLSNITGVKADIFELVITGGQLYSPALGAISLGAISPRLCCTTWAVSHVNIRYDTHMDRRGLPDFAMASLGALLGSRACAYENIRVNGMAPAAALSAAAPNAARAAEADWGSSDADSSDSE